MNIRGKLADLILKKNALEAAYARLCELNRLHDVANERLERAFLENDIGSMTEVARLFKHAVNSSDQEAIAKYREAIHHIQSF